ncbi:MAG: FAD-dependent oxidoreductase [Dehalococcoidales bacterium]|nr:FAD-dependent oxidoreductase [Dehalococcoidales bacterium]
MGNENKFDAIVVGAGPSGTTAAYVLAKAGLDVVLLERGAYPGAKNIFGGVLFTTVLNRIIPNFWEEAPVERHMKGIQIFLISENNGVSIGVQSEDHNKPPYNNSFTVSRAKFDQWYASKAEEVGAFLLTNTVVDDLLWDGNRVVGVKARGEEGELYSDVVIIAEGTNSLLTQKAGLRGKYVPRQVSLGMKEIIELPREVIEERFQLSGNEGIELKYLAGDATKGIWGGGNIYTNLESLSVVLWLAVKPLTEHRVKVTELMERFKEHPMVRNYIRGGKTIEYQAHLAPDGGYDFTPKYFTNGLLVVGDAARFLNASLHYEGTNFAMASGEAAAETVIEAKRRGDFSEQSLSYYQKLLNNSFVMKDLKRYRKMNRFAEDNPEFFDAYFKAITQMAVDYFTINELPKRRQEWKMLKKAWLALNYFNVHELPKLHPQNKLSRAFNRAFPLVRFLWQCLKGAWAFL